MSLTIRLNEPIELALTRLDPKTFNHAGKPPSHMYSVVLRDGTAEKIFLPPSCSQSITELHIGTNEFFTLCKRKTPQGTEYFEVEAPTRSARTANVAPAPQAAQARAAQPHAGQANATQPRRASSVMSAALIAAIDAATEAQEYAASKGIGLAFGPEDVRCIANTLYIQASKDPLFGERANAGNGQQWRQ